jgi:hypothetical protein
MLALLAPLVLVAPLARGEAPTRVEVHHTASAERGTDRAFLRLRRDGQPDWISKVYRAWSAHTADLDGDGEAEVVLGVWSTTPRHAEPEPHRTVWVLDARDGGLYERWRGSALARPLRDVRVLPAAPADRLIALEQTGDTCTLTVYRWHGFGVVGDARRPTPCAPFCDERAPCVTTADGPRRARWRDDALTLEPWP